MSEYRQQALIEAPPETVWDLVGDPRRHPDWMPRIVEVRGEHFAVGDEYAQVTRDPFGVAKKTTMMVDGREDLREVRLHCTKTGLFTNWTLTGAQGNTFVDAEFGMEPKGVMTALWDRTFGRRYFRSWMDQSLAALQNAAARASSAPR